MQKKLTKKKHSHEFDFTTRKKCAKSSNDSMLYDAALKPRITEKLTPRQQITK